MLFLTFKLNYVCCFGLNAYQKPTYIFSNSVKLTCEALQSCMRIVTKQFVISEIFLHLVMQRIILTDSTKTIDLYRYMVILFFL